MELINTVPFFYIILYMSLLNQIFCKHEYEFLSNIPGPQRQFCGWNLTVYKCKKCGSQKYYKDWINKEFDWKDFEENINLQIRYFKKNEHI